MAKILTLPYPPTVNTYWRIGRRGKSSKRMMILSERAQAFHLSALPAIIQSGLRLEDQLFSVTVGVWFPDARSRDTDNLWKPILDTLQRGGAFEDDDQAVDSRIIACGIDRKNPRIQVIVRPVSPDWCGIREFDEACR
jgi:crossover junction endodeoxyribonuclease RusA